MNIKKGASILGVILIITLTMASFCACSNNVANVSTVEPAEEMSIDTTVNTQHGIRLARAEAVTAEDGTVSQRLTATVYPENTYDNSVVWSIAWATEECDDNLDDYLTLSSTTGNTVYVFCHQSFGTQAIITVKSAVDESISATCTVDYRRKMTSARPQLVPANLFEGEADYPWWGDTFYLFNDECFTVEIDGEFIDESEHDLECCCFWFYDPAFTDGTLPANLSISSLVLSFTPEAMSYAFNIQNYSMTLQMDSHGHFYLDNFNELYQFDFSSAEDVAFVNYLKTHCGLRLTATLEDGSSYYGDYYLKLGAYMQEQLAAYSPQSISPSSSQIEF